MNLNAMKRRAQEAGAMRMKGLGLVAIITGIALAMLYPHQLGTVLAKINLLALAAWGGYWIDRSAFPYARCHEDPNEFGEVRRAIIIAAAMLAMALAL